MATVYEDILALCAKSESVGFKTDTGVFCARFFLDAPGVVTEMGGASRPIAEGIDWCGPNPVITQAWGCDGPIYRNKDRDAARSQAMGDLATRCYASGN